METPGKGNMLDHKAGRPLGLGNNNKGKVKERRVTAGFKSLEVTSYLIGIQPRPTKDTES